MKIIKFGLMLFAAFLFSSQVHAISINDAGVVGTIEQGTQNSSEEIEIQWAQYLLGLTENLNVDFNPPTSSGVTDNGDNINGDTEYYETGSNAYSGTLTDAFKQDGGLLTGWTNYEWVLGKYDGQNAGIVLFNVADYIAANGTSLPQYDCPLWGTCDFTDPLDPQQQYQLSHWTGFNAVPAPAILGLMGIGLIGMVTSARMRRRKIS